MSSASAWAGLWPQGLLSQPWASMWLQLHVEEAGRLGAGSWASITELKQKALRNALLALPVRTLPDHFVLLGRGRQRQSASVSGPAVTRSGGAILPLPRIPVPGSGQQGQPSLLHQQHGASSTLCWTEEELLAPTSSAEKPLLPFVPQLIRGPPRFQAFLGGKSGNLEGGIAPARSLGNRVMDQRLRNLLT